MFSTLGASLLVTFSTFNNECICKAHKNKWFSDALHRRAGVESFQFPPQMSEPSRKTYLKAAVRLFQMAAAETAKSLAPMTVLVRRTSSFMVSQTADVVDRQQPRPGHNRRLGTTGRDRVDT